ncbi:MAG: T9SS type A sorting domain-containing protein [bacterium]
MKKILLFSLACILGLAVMAQKVQLKNTVPTQKQVTGQAVANEPVRSIVLPVTPGPSMVNSDNPDIVSIITIGTSANGYGYGYAGGQKTMVWADDNLDAVINFHRLGPGAAPPSLSGYLGFDMGTNGAIGAGDWVINQQVYAATLNAGGTYYADAGRYPQGLIYNPGGTVVDNAYCVFYAPNLSNALYTWGGQSYGRAKLTNTADSTKHLYWYSPPPYTYIPDGMMITAGGTVLVTDLNQSWESGLEYQGSIILNTGIWNATDLDFEYTMNLIEHPTLDNQRPVNERIGASPDGNTVWIVSLANTGNLPAVGGVMERFYPVMFQSIDGGATWSDPIDVQLDGPTGLPAILNFLSDYRIQQLYTPPYPARDEIPYTTAFDCDIVVDKWGNPHVGVVVGVAADGYSIATGDSAYAVFDIFSTDDGVTWCAVLMGHPTTFRGTFGDIYEDNRVNASINPAGDKVFISWIDTQIPGVTDNINPDVFLRGFDLVANKITAAPDNVTFLSDVTQQAYFACASYYTFTDGDDCRIPIVTELLSDPNDPVQPVTFKYVADYEVTPSDFTLDAGPCVFPVGIDPKVRVNTLSIYPNPVKDLAVVNVNLMEGSNVQISITNMLGQTVLNLNKGYLTAGAQQLTLDVTSLKAGVYFCTVQINGEKYSQKMIVE